MVQALVSHELNSYHQHLKLKAIRQHYLRSLLSSLRMYAALYIWKEVNAM